MDRIKLVKLIQYLRKKFFPKEIFYNIHMIVAGSDLMVLTCITANGNTYILSGTHSVIYNGIKEIYKDELKEVIL